MSALIRSQLTRTLEAFINDIDEDIAGEQRCLDLLDANLSVYARWAADDTRAKIAALEAEKDAIIRRLEQADTRPRSKSALVRRLEGATVMTALQGLTPASVIVERFMERVRREAERYVVVSIKSRARAMLAEPWQLEMIEPELGAMPPAAMAEHVAELLAAARAERRRQTTPIFGATDLMNLMGAALAARMLQRQEWRAGRDIAKAA